MTKLTFQFFDKSLGSKVMRGRHKFFPKFLRLSVAGALVFHGFTGVAHADDTYGYYDNNDSNHAFVGGLHPNVTNIQSTYGLQLNLVYPAGSQKVVIGNASLAYTDPAYWA